MAIKSPGLILLKLFCFASLATGIAYLIYYFAMMSLLPRFESNPDSLFMLTAIVLLYSAMIACIIFYCLYKRFLTRNKSAN